MTSVMSNVGAKSVRDNHKATDKLATSHIQGESKRAITSAQSTQKIHHLPCSISRMVIPTSIAQYRGFFIIYRSAFALLCGVFSERNSLRLSTNPEKCFSSSPRSFCLTVQHPPTQRSTKVPPSALKRRCKRQASGKGKHVFRFAFVPKRSLVCRYPCTSRPDATLNLKKKKND